MKSFFQSKLFFALITSAILAAVAYGVFLMGSPAKHRALQLDEKRVSHLQQISYAIDSFWRKESRLPAKLQDLKGYQDIYLESIQDPATGILYEYTAEGEQAYILCAVFETDTFREGALYAPKPFSDPWEHGIGRTCFGRQVRVQVN
ncbi:MAG: hypothetical protein HYT50_00420 [Candidatus Wildermuthbacteria bacterium]|nr:hypothetical protein [Candidatus Wildermuthbacteria bacterium]